MYNRAHRVEITTILHIMCTHISLQRYTLYSVTNMPDYWEYALREWIEASAHRVETVKSLIQQLCGWWHKNDRLLSSDTVLTRGQSNLTNSASRGPIPRLGVTPGGRKLYH